MGGTMKKPSPNVTLHGHLPFDWVMEHLISCNSVGFKGRVWRLVDGILTCDTGLCAASLHDPNSLKVIEEAFLACLDNCRDDFDPKKNRPHYNHCYNCPLGADIPNLGIEAMV